MSAIRPHPTIPTLIIARAFRERRLMKFGFLSAQIRWRAAYYAKSYVYIGCTYVGSATIVSLKIVSMNFPSILNNVNEKLYYLWLKFSIL
jgi:hypothetical protein